MDFWDKLANPNAKTEAEAAPGVPKPKTEGRDWLDDAIDRQGLGEHRDFVRSVFAQESSSGKADTSKPNDKGARGPMQVREIAFRDMQQRGYIPKDYRWDNPEHSAEAGVAYLKHGIKTYNGDTRKAAAFYFGGPDAVRKDGTIEMDRSDGKTTVREYIDKTHSRMKGGAPRAEKTSAQAGATKIPKWSDIVQSPQFAALNAEEREQLRAEYRNEALPKAVGPDQLAELQAAFDESTQLSFFDHARLTLKQTGSEIAEGGRSATQGLRGRSLAQDMKRVEEHKAAAAAARAAGDETTAEQYDAAAAAALSEAKVADKEIAASNKSSTFVARSSVQRMLEAKTAEDAWGAFKSDPLNVIAGITAQSAAAMAPGLVFAALAGGGIPGAVMMGANSAMMENGSSLLDFAAENGVDAKSEGALVKFYSDPENLRAGLSYAGTRATIIGMADAATGGIASKTIAPKALKSAVAKQFVNVPTQMAVQAGGGAAGEAGAQLATKGEIDAPGQVLAEAVGELATAPADVAVLAKDSISSKEPGSKSAGLRNLAKRLRGEPVDAGAVVDNPTEGAQVPALAPRGVAGAPIPDDTGIVTREVREKVNVTPDMVLDKGDAGQGNRPALPPPGGTGGTPTQSEIRVDGAGNATKVQVDRTVRQIGNEPGLTGGMRVDSAGNVSMETGPQAMEAEQERLRREDLGISPVSVPSKPAIPKKARSKTKSLRSEYSANQALSDRAAPGWKSPTGKTIEEVLRARPRPKEEPKPTPQRKKLFGLFSKRGITKTKGGTYVAPEQSTDPNFKRWFGASKTKQGAAPQVYFHGTAADIESFQPKQAGAIFLSPDPQFAESFAHASLEWLKKHLPNLKPEVMAKVDERAREMVRQNYEAQDVDDETLNYYLDNVRMTDEWLYASMDALDSGPNILPVFVRAERPFDGSNPEHAARVASHLSAGKGVFTLQSNQWTEDDLIESLDRGDWTVLESPEVQAAIKALGHDSFYVTEGGQKNLAVYNPNQIKSAVGNIKFGEGDNIVASRKTKEKTNAAEPTGARGDDARAVRGGQEQVAGDSRPDQGDVRVLEGAPGAIDIPGRGRVTFGLWDKALDVAKSYAKRAGIQFKPLTDWKKVDKERAARVAAEYAAMAHAPGDPQVAAAYAAMIKETSAQYEEILKSGLKVEFIRGADPYAASPRLAVLDMIENNHLWVFSTRDGFGSNATFDPKDNPLLAETKFEISGEKALANDIFRVVHDYFGHAMYGAGFRADGEENAWRAHSQMYSPQARRAMTTETRGQNSWVNFGPHGETNRSASGSETVYADQKTGLLPAWVMHDGAPQGGEQVKATPATKSVSSETGRGMDVAEVTKIVDDFSAVNKGANKLNIYVVQSAEEVEGLPSGVEGVYVGEDGSVILVADSLNPKRAAEVIAHEIVGHHGVESIIAAAGPGFERRWIEILKDVARVRAKGGYASMENVRQEYGDNQLIGAMEVLARMAETGEKHSLLTKAVSLIRDVLRKLGINLRMSDSDLIELVTRARGAVARGENISNAETKAWHAKLMSMSDEAADMLMSRAEKATTPAFKAWFGDSKVVGADGNPKVVYHGTASDFSEFDPDRIGATFGDDKSGFFFTSSPGEYGGASSYAKRAGRDGGSPNVIPVYLSIRNPLRLTDDKGMGPIAYLEDWKYGYGIRKQEIIEGAINDGHDGVIVDSDSTSETLYVAFRPEQIKSAIGNGGGFDAQSKNILFSKKRWSAENAAFEVAPGGNAAIKGEWDKLPLARRAEITLALSKAIVPAVAELFTSAKATVQSTVGGWMGDVNPSVALKLPSASTVEAQRIAAAVAYVFDQDAGLHVSAKGTQDAIVVELADGQDGEALYKSLPGNKKEFIGFTSSGDGMMEFLVDDAAKSLPKLQAHFGPAKVSVAQRGFSFLDKKDYKAARDSLPEADQDALDGLRDQARALMRISLSPERTGTQISTAPVTATAERTWLDPMKQRITVGIDHILGLGPKGVQIHAELMAKMANIRPKPGRTPAETIEAAVEHFKSNILWLYDQTLPAVRERAKLWYVGGNKIARQMSKFYGISHEQGAALIAVLSPQRDWFVNVSLARRVLDIWKHRQDFTATHEMFMAAVADRTGQSADARATQIKLANKIAGKKLSELSNPLEAAVWIRSFDETYNARTYRAISPEGETLGLAMNDDGETPASVQWGSNGTIAAAVSVLRDGSMENISTQLGSGHKVRNFYTNLIDPSDPHAITVDTHAVGVATLRPMSSDSEEVKNAFGGNTKGERGPVTSTIIGSNGTYGIFAEAYRRAAAERGILPREMQSITWEAVRGMFRAADKRTTSAPVEALWNQYKRGRMTLDRVREELKEVADADGINAPSWTAAHHQLDEDEQGAHEDLGLSGAGRDGGAGSGEPVAQGPRRRLGLHSVAATGGGSGVVEFSRRKPAPGSVSVDAWHWSHGQLSELSGFMYGQGIRGAEAERLSGAPEEIRRRVYFYTQRDNGTIPLREGGLGPNRHEVRLANLWKSGISPSIKVEPVGWTQSGIFIRDEAGTRNAWEMALLKAGYDGYVDGLSGVAVVLNSDVPVQFVRAAGLQSRATQTPANASPAARTGLLDGAFKLGMGWVGRLLSGPAYDYLIRQGARIVPDRVKHGLVSDFGLEGMYLDAKIDRTAAVNKVLRETKNLLDSLAGLTREQSRVAYLWMAEKPDTELEQQLLAQIPADDRATLRNMKSLIDTLGREAVSVGLLTPDSYERNKMAYLHRIYEAHMKPGAAGAAAKRAAAIRAENFKGRGIRHDVKADALVQAIDEIKEGDLLDRWEARSPSGKVTAVRYVKHGAAGPKGYTKADTWEARWLDRPGNKVGLWRDMTAEERHKLGEIEEVRFAFAKTVINGIRDIENAKFLKWVAEKYATEDAPADKIIGDPSTGYWATQAFKPDEFVRVPDTEIAGTKLKKYGALAGKIIPAPVWNDIRNQLARPADATSAAWDALVRNWKLSKTALSPAVHTNNVMSNFVLADLAEVRARDIVKAMRVIVAAKRGDAAAKTLIDRFEDSGADYGSFANIELSQLYIEPLLAELEKVENNELGLLKASQIVNLAMQGHVLTAGKAAMEKAAWVKKPFELMMRAYQSEDSVFRLAKFMRETEAGKPDREAGKAARDSFLDYNINAPWIQAARRSVLPFIAFSYRAIPMMLNAAAHKPWKFAKYLAVGYALNAAAYAMLGLGGDDEDRERKLLPDELDGRLLGVFPRLIRMPWNDAHGSPVFLDARRWVPGGDMVDLNQSQAALPVPSWLSVSGPLSIMMEFFSNKSSFTGREIVKDTDTKAEAMAKVVDHLFKAFAPNLPLPGPGTIIPGTDRGQLQTYAWTGLLDAGTGRTDAFGRDQSLATAALSSVGVKARAYPEDALRLRAVQDFQQAQREIQNNIKGLARELSRNGITQQEFDRRVEREKQKLEKASETLRKKL
jgi:hypothetical protein